MGWVPRLCDLFNVVLNIRDGALSYLLTESKESNSENLSGETARTKYPRIPKKWGKLYNMPHLHKKRGENAEILSSGHGVHIFMLGCRLSKHYANHMWMKGHCTPPPCLCNKAAFLQYHHVHI